MNFNPLQKTLAPLLRKTLDAYSARQTAISENIANVETRGFRPIKVEFEDELLRAMEKSRPVGKKSDPRHFDIGNTMKSLRERVEETDTRVNLEQEMAELARNQIRFDFVARKLRGGYEQIKQSISGRVA